ncbi:hypothetical protein TARUN_7221 [Trichoderma arundinaceum]|uniref:Uncharacterized protein n=1 Tax=Trichoderma arundinaceum TaxID=490622 RepID=A0A395NFV7_TRIAR|nr:hypothetical protein TARUN_7221 [Trichoderma arundinaceum]
MNGVYLDSVLTTPSAAPTALALDHASLWASSAESNDPPQISTTPGSQRSSLTYRVHYSIALFGPPKVLALVGEAPKTPALEPELGIPGAAKDGFELIHMRSSYLTRDGNIHAIAERRTQGGSTRHPYCTPNANWQGCLTEPYTPPLWWRGSAALFCWPEE